MIINYEAPEVKVIETMAATVVCASQGSGDTEDFTIEDYD